MNLERLFRPRSIAVYGGVWSDYVVEQCLKLGFDGEIWRVHPKREGCYRTTADLPNAPDSAFLGISRSLVIKEVQELNNRGAGGAVVFAAGFGEVADGKELANKLSKAAGDMPFTGPNCYGFANFFDRLSLWPDQAVGHTTERGVAILGQSGTVSISLMYQRRSLPVGYVITMGNQQRLDCSDLIRYVADDDRVSAIGMYLESIGDLDKFVQAVSYAREKGKPIALVKVGKSSKSQETAFSHTGSLTGSDTLHNVLFDRLGIARCSSLAELVETLKLFHCFGPLPSNKIAVMGASGGDMAMVSDLAHSLDIEFPPQPVEQVPELEASTGPGVVIDNPFDFHTYTWFDSEMMHRMFRAMLRSNYAVVAFMLDPPDETKADPSSFDLAVDMLIKAVRESNSNAAMLSSLSDNLSAYNHAKGLGAGVAPMQGLPEFLKAVEHSAKTGRAWRNWNPPRIKSTLASECVVRTVMEHDAKALLKEFGLLGPVGLVVDIADAGVTASTLGYPVVVKASGADLAHKTELGGVVLNLHSENEVQKAADEMSSLCNQVLVESMVTDGVCELILGVTRDDQFGLAITIGAGGVFTELLKDSVSLLLPLNKESVEVAIRSLKVISILEGWRGAESGDITAVVNAVINLAEFTTHYQNQLMELDINPLIVRPMEKGVVVADALIRIQEN